MPRLRRSGYTGTNRIAIAVALSALVPIIIFGLWYALSTGFRDFVLSLNPRTLTYIQSWRLAGITFVILQAHGILPALFALPAGIGDMAIGATAFLAARSASPTHRTRFLFWQRMGIADLIMAVGLGTTLPLFSGPAPSMAPMTVLSLSLVPTFIVPLLFILHLICIAQARSWTSTAPDALDYHLNAKMRSRSLAH